ncbi:hypothetical protein BUALT_Bualt01G0093000 [Buddleja alternifolia]|uniref:Ubiquitin thioesterase OTU n=1 Tax=Buddleja alternifolia TaxID=168488 RepID=A0AAV6YCN1_9LAMI|nr:hypothetical protein BUALT_Bualt01G0093000 [Buddleja alternifolia]
MGRFGFGRSLTVTPNHTKQNPILVMLGVLYARLRPWSLTSLSLSYAAAAAPFDRLTKASLHRREHSLPTNCGGGGGGGSASIWHAIMPSYWRRWRTAVLSRHDHDAMKRGEGSWNVAWDARPARWLHHPDSAWLMFGVCAGLSAPLLDCNADLSPEVTAASANRFEIDASEYASCNYRVTGVAADGRCLFRAIAHMACLANGEKAPDENRQRELADELRAQVVKELLKRRKEVEWSIEEDFDVYVKRIQEPYVWGGEPELLMSSHVLRTPISVFMKEGSSSGFTKIANYGEEYRKDEENSINVLFHGYGHYDILEPYQIQI